MGNEAGKMSVKCTKLSAIVLLELFNVLERDDKTNHQLTCRPTQLKIYKLKDLPKVKNFWIGKIKNVKKD